MADTEFKLGTFAKNGGDPYVGLVIGEKIYPLSAVTEAYGKRGPATTAGIQEMLDDWDVNFEALCAIADFVADDARDPVDWGGAAALANLRVLPPILKPAKMTP